MHLKRLEAFGFKSFADKITFDFERGFTCFVGPNGCGKSNVVDAIKWVLGEQSAKSLRGGEMLDVIFNGSASRKALSFAEVSLTFDNASGKLPLAAPEVSVTRRLYRSGDSEYLINKALCRLRDVRELFWDTGVGTSSYSIIEQGRVAALLEANSKDRRVLFEEAAGIHKYKERKKIALRKLERVELNVERLSDLLGEVERNLKTVTRQAEKAKKAKEISDKLRQTRLDILLHEAFTSHTALQEVTASLNMAAERAAGLAEELSRAQVLTAEHESGIARIDKRVSDAQQQLADARGKLQRLEAEIEGERRSIDELSMESDRARMASRAAGDRAAAIAQERERVELDASRAQENFTERSERAAALSLELAGAQEAREALVRALENARRAAMDALGRRTQLQDTLVRAEADLGSLEYRVRKSQAQMTRAEDQLRFAQAESEEVRGRIREVLQRREGLETEQLGLRSLQRKTEEEISRLSRSTQELQRELESRRSRLTALEGLRESGEGLSPGARAVLTHLREELDLGNEVHGLVADCLGVDPRLEHAIEAALGGHIETIVVQSARAAQVLAARLCENELGRATFLPLDRAEAVQTCRPLLARPPAGAPGYLGVAADLITCDEKYRPVAQALLGNVLVFDTGTHAAESFHADMGSSGWNRVSLSGGFFESSGCLAGGRHKAQRLGLIGRKNEIARLGVQMDEYRMRIEALAERTAFLEKRAQKVARDEERVELDLASLAHSHTEFKSMLAAIEREESRSAEEKNLAVREIHELEAERAAHVERVIAMRVELDDCRRAESDAAAAVLSRETELSAREESLAASRQQMADVERERATWRERVSALEREGQSLSAQFAERRDEAEREGMRAQSLDERRAMAISSVAEKDRQRAEWSDLIDIYVMQNAALQEEKEHARLAYEQARGKEREIATELEKAREELSQVREREVTLRVRLESKLEQGRSEFQIDALAELTTRGGPPPLTLPHTRRSAVVQAPSEETANDSNPMEGDAPESAAETTEVTPQQADAIQRAQELVKQLEERLQRMGPVNMYALEEMQELEKRHGFLKVQFEDLQSARASLRDVIARINRRSRNLFQETFEAVKAQFNDTFRKLFGGGKADLILEEGEDILEAGIEIVARPPGTEPRTVSLLSGGQKTMTMIALLLAVFRSRPAPFCILDEVDAPLDEANVERFNVTVREFLDQSQFLVITHNKKTMSYAHVLYGITMPEPGVSKRIAIKFEEIDKHLPMDEIDRSAETARKEAQAHAETATPASEPAETPAEDAGELQTAETSETAATGN